MIFVFPQIYTVDVADELEQYHGGNHVMTDDKAPVEVLGMQALDGLINDEVDYYREIYNKEGMKGLLNLL